MEKLIKIQGELKAPKGQFNSFGQYKYRSCEDILEAVKPLCVREGLLLTLTDEIVHCGEGASVFIDAKKEKNIIEHALVYVKATATITDGEKTVSVSALARESITKKGMDASQITGSASSYARKYALNGLFLIDDTKDADTQENSTTVEYISEKQMNTIVDLITSTESDIEKFCSFLGVKGLDEIPASEYQRAVKALQTKGAK